MKKGLKFFCALFLSIITFNCNGNAHNLKDGDNAPSFNLKDVNGNSYNLSSYRGKSPVVIYFYPAANTPGCTKEACGIRDSWDNFKNKNIVVLGISVDSKEKIKQFINNYNLNFPLLSDENKTVSKTYGVLNKFGIDNRITFIVDKTGYINTIIRNVDVNTHANEVYKLASQL
jgi:thioredoxin-dependent peroxiredoxin